MERREHERYGLWFPVRVDSETVQEGLAVCHDASQTGILLATALTLDIGARVTVTFRVPPDDPLERKAEATVVRVEPNTDDPYGLWPNHIALVFDTPIPDLEGVLQQQAKRGLGLTR